MSWLDVPSTAFEGSRCIASGTLKEVALATKPVVDRWASSISPPPILIFEDASSAVIELDWRGTLADFEARLMALDLVMTAAMPPVPAEETPVVADAPRGPGRPKLGVSAREVTLLPRHWEWLARQPGGASVALRKLVETARLSSEVKDRVRHCAAVTYKFMSTMAGHEPGFEEASRALFAGDRTGLEARMSGWPADVQTHLKKILTEAFQA